MFGTPGAYSFQYEGEGCFNDSTLRLPTLGLLLPYHSLCSHFLYRQQDPGSQGVHACAVSLSSERTVELQLYQNPYEEQTYI